MQIFENTIKYYNLKSETFTNTTQTVDFESTQKRFLSRLHPASHLLDFGCGSGRDTKYFLSHGHTVDAIDGSEEMCKIAAKYTGIPVKQMLFHRLDEQEKYDGIWACASILHLPLQDLETVLHKMSRALKPYGIIYTSFKYGTFEGERNGRYFTDMTEETFAVLLKRIPTLTLEEQWISSDVRPGRGDEKWLNLTLRKSNIH
ncbi:MAG: class I SAM-dependent methyltransferase [Lachnospiraceae bacterium]|nr:class I SAM-dependent methyltransferase [Lachnospiraceae bacterium]